MTTTTERRDFLRQAAAAGLVLGLPWGRAHAGDGTDAVGRQPKLLRTALDLVAARKVFGVAIVVPTAPAAQKALLRDLARLVGGPQVCETAAPIKSTPRPSAEIERVLRRAVFVCLAADQVEQAFGSAVAGRSGAVVFDASGKAVELLPQAPALYRDGFVKQMSAALDGPDGKRLDATAAAQRKALTEAQGEQVDLALARLDARQYAKRQAATKTLSGLASQISGVLMVARRDARSLEVQSRIDQVLLGQAALAPAQCLPFGVRWRSNAVDPCPGCGMGSAPSQVRRFLELTTGARGK